MKVITIIGAILLVATSQINAFKYDSSTNRSFTEDVANFTDSMLLHEKYNTSSLSILVYKISAIYQALWIHRIDQQAYHNTFNTLSQLQYMITSWRTPDRMLETIAQSQNRFDYRLDDISKERDVDEIYLPSEINTIIDDFFKHAINLTVPFFEEMYEKTTNSFEEVEQICAELIGEVDTLVKKLDTCSQLPLTAFSDTYQCREDVRSLLPDLANDTARLNVIYNRMRDIEYGQVNGEQSLRGLERKFQTEANETLRRIWTLKQKREQDKDSKQGKTTPDAGIFGRKQ